MNITSAFVDILQKESDRVWTSCQVLNRSEDFKRNCLSMLPDATHPVTYLSEHVLLRDLQSIFKAYFGFKKGVSNASIPSKFALVYLYDKLQGRDLKVQFSIQKLNELTISPRFDQNLDVILNTSFFPTIAGMEQEYILPSILAKAKNDELITIESFLNRVTSLMVKSDKKLSAEEEEFLNQVSQKTNHPKIAVDQANYNEVPENDTLELVLAELHELIGLDQVKKNIEDLTNFLKVQKLRQENGLKSSSHALHAVFVGPPGTGKTTVARLLGRIYKHLGYLSKGHLIETDRTGMVAGYVGQTAIKADEIIKSAIGGVLFIDEAYSLTSRSGMDDFGNEAIEIMLKRMEDHRHDFVVVVAGYPDEMSEFIQANPGLQSRFNRYFEFDHYTSDAMMEIFKLYTHKGDFVLTEDADNKLNEIFERLYEKRHKGFGNARAVRNLFEKVIERQANRIIQISPMNKDTLVHLIEEDVPEILQAVKDIIIYDEAEETKQ